MKIKIAFLALLIAGMAVLVNAQSADVGVSIVDSAVVGAGSHIHLVVNVTNNQGFDDMFHIGVSGGCPSWAALSKESLDVPANSQGQVVLTVSPPYSTSMTQCKLDVSAYSDADQVSKWNKDSVNIRITTALQTGRDHYQSDVDVNPDYSLSASLSASGMSTGHIAVDTYFNPKLQTRGYVLNDDGQICVGDSFTIDGAALVGEWYQKGGPNDSPPIEFVDNLDAVKAQIGAGTYSTKVYRGTVCSWNRFKQSDTGPPQCVVDGAVICSYDCEMQNAGPIKKLSDYRFEITGEGSVEVKIECPVECIFFVDRKEETYILASSPSTTTDMPKAYGIMAIASPGTLTSTTTLNAITQARGPDLRVIKTAYLPRVSEDQPMYARLLVENAGDMEAIIDSVTLNLPNCEVMYKPKTMFPGEEAEVLVKADAGHISELKASFDYRADNLGCLRRKEFSETFSLGRIEVLGSRMCSENAGCDGFGLTTPLCCKGICRDAAIGSCDDFDGDGIFEWGYY